MTIFDMYKSRHALAKHYQISPGRLTRHLEALVKAERVELRSIQIGNQTRYHIDDVSALLELAHTHQARLMQ